MFTDETRLLPRNAEAIWQAIGQHAIVSVADLAGTITYVNEQFVNVSGYSREELLGQNHRILKSNVQSDGFWATMWATISAGLVWQGVVCNRNKNGSLYWVQAQISPFFDETGAIEHYVSIRTDITAHVRMQSELELANELSHTLEALNQRKRYLRATLDSLPFLFWLKDAQGHYLAVNQAFAKACKRASTDEVLGLTDLDLWPSAEALHYQKIDNEVMQCQQQKTREDRHMVAGRSRWVEVFIKPLFLENGEVSGTVGFSRDITERKRSDAMLLEKTEQLDAVFDLSPDGFVSFDEKRRVLFVNSAFERMTGLCMSQLVGVNEFEFSCMLAARCTVEGRFCGVEVLRQRGGVDSDGEQIELAFATRRVLQVRLRSGQAINISQILHFHDVTHESEVERVKSEFLTAAAHELRTPMVSIYGFAELLQSQGLEEANRQEVLDIMFKQSQWMITILNNLLDLASIDSRQGKDFVFESIHVQQLMAEVLQEFKLPSGSLAPVLGMPGVPLIILADPKRARQAVLNVLGNAYKYANSHSHVNICVKPLATGVSISVADQGIGMTPDQLARVGERFYRADASGKVPGTGLGMSIVKEIMALHDGSVEFQSELGRGTTVTLLFPVFSQAYLPRSSA